MSDCTTPWTVACQAPLSMGVSRQEYWSGLPFLLDPGTKSVTCISCTGKWILYHCAPLGSPFWNNVFLILNISFLTIFPYKTIWNRIENINYKTLFISVPYLSSSSFKQLNLFSWWILFILTYKSRKREMSFSSEKHAPVTLEGESSTQSWHTS